MGNFLSENQKIMLFLPQPSTLSRPLPPRRRSRKRTAAARASAQRRQRIFARMQQGWSYEAIAEDEGVSRERIRQIVKEGLEGRDLEPDSDHLRLQLARLDPALRLAAEQVSAGNIKAIDKLIRVLAQIDKYQAQGAGREWTMAPIEEEPEWIAEKREPTMEEIDEYLEYLDRINPAPEREEPDARRIILEKLAMVDERRAASARDGAAESGWAGDVSENGAGDSEAGRAAGARRSMIPSPNFFRDKSLISADSAKFCCSQPFDFVRFGKIC
jgi:Homeodomain-like domain